MTLLLQKQGSLGFKKKSYGASSLDINLYHPLFPRALHVGQQSFGFEEQRGGFMALVSAFHRTVEANFEYCGRC